MKVVLLVVAAVLILGTPVFAQNIILAQPGFLPDNPLHPFQDFFEQLQLFFAFSSQDKANVHLQLAEKRLAELNLSIALNKTDLVPILTQDFENEINETENNINETQRLGQNVTALAQHVAEETFKHQLVLENLLNKVPDQARSGIENALNKSQEGHDNAVESIFENRNVTGIVNFTFTIDNQTFTQIFNITSEHGRPHIEGEHTENEGGGGAIPISGNVTTATTTITSSCSNNFDCLEKMKCVNSTCISVGCVPEGGQIPGAISPDYRKHMANECCAGLQVIPYSGLYDSNCNQTMIVGAPSGICSRCGNGVCESWETKCTCPEDCNITSVNITSTTTTTLSTTSTTSTSIQCNVTSCHNFVCCTGENCSESLPQECDNCTKSICA